MPANKLAGGFSEADHPRDADGKFAAGNSFSVPRFENGQEKLHSFSEGDFVRASISSKLSDKGEITAISQAKGQAKVNGVWHPFGAIYKADRPVLNKLRPTIKLSKAVANANKRHGADDWGAADAVPAHLQSGKR